MAINIPVYFMTDDGEISLTPVHKAVPVIPITFTAADKDNLNTAPNPEKHKYTMVLLDTGATGCFIDESFADDLDMPVIKEINVLGATSTIKSTVRATVMCFTDDGRLFRQEVSTAPLSANGRKFLAAFGMEFLEHCSLTLDFENNKFELLFNS
ncbi:retropepsin-like aspartic protease [Superficieibacter sp. HKU1]|uniref:retropepsin-like aspartic protease n=1 Tax=Superficieibacter sp. HKU1 TaxID=3031919 RepID=UPI0023E32210|nr:retropepsin-like aspartic protease [Superficieibacter sp. HKU1]WES67205.1 retropepsin-like aspartic protease [Superficieibacter sp. HKU1]